MKKTSLALLSMIVVGVASAEDLLTPEEHPEAPVGISFATPVQTPGANYSINGFRWNILYGENYSVTGFDFGLVGGSGLRNSSDSVRAKSAGFQLDLLAGWNGFDYSGCQIAGFGNVMFGNFSGFQLAGFANYDRGGFTGCQIAPLNYVVAATGVQIGVLNVTKNVSYGLQIGVYNNNPNEFHGWSIGGINCADRIDGLQLGFLNMVSQSGRGVQIGVFNSAVNFKGVQIGAMNMIGNGEFPIMPVLNANF